MLGFKSTGYRENDFPLTVSDTRNAAGKHRLGESEAIKH
jgi:hypothetical protein